MNTEELIAALSAEVTPVRPGAVDRRLRWACVAGAGLGLVLLLAWLGVRPDLHLAMRTPAFWMKAGYTAWLALGGFLLTARLARPDGRPGATPWLLIAGFAMVAVLGALNLALAPPAQKAAAMLGHSWTLCPWRIALIAAPGYIAIAWSLRRLAPTRLTLAGAAAGLLAGALGATVYGLACDETSATFLALWYTLGIAGCAAVGAVLGRWVLRW